MRRARASPLLVTMRRGFLLPRNRNDFMEKNAGFMKALKCRECGREYPLTATHVCEFDFGPLEVVYDYARIKKALTRSAIESRPQSRWRYGELLPVAEDPTAGTKVGLLPFLKPDPRPR